MSATKRFLAMKAVYDFLGDFPEPFHTGHTAVCHCGYSWDQPNGSTKDFVLENESGDIITREDFDSMKLLFDSPIVIKLGNTDDIFNASVFDKHELITDKTIAHALEEKMFSGKTVTSILELCDEIKKISDTEHKKFFIHTFNNEVANYRWDT
ncbi:hypothetical protein [Photobacterium damselae]|uniref:hypothetical protein n=1 Tax=Photobacterium damselae TaxID=38293 RepID=UPI001F2BE04B|nr:hypothetical protein [Photobacterium damselae]UKA05005.1 hypothetical protein IHC89_22425 [Photobacterium damselae subsp. damselae]